MCKILAFLCAVKKFRVDDIVYIHVSDEDEEDTPMIRGFSDDEPLVIA